jgi:hypothetical protein
MNPKMFALLLLIPVAVFATDKLTSSAADGGGKEKRKTEAPIAATNAEATVENEPTESAAETQTAQSKTDIVSQASNSKITDEKSAAIASIRQMIEAHREAGDYDNADYENRMYIYDDEENDELKNWLFKEVKTRLEDSNPMSLNLAEQFSRCPSGYHVFVVTKDEQPTNEGWIAEDSGCWDRPVTKFRYDFAAKTVEADAGELGFMPMDKFFKLLKAAKV